MGICKHNHSAPDETLEALHIAQEGPQRHKCVECAYHAGYEYGREHATTPGGNAECTYMNRRAPKEVIDALPESQAGKGRHKCAVCAYQEGFERARAEVIGGQVGADVSRSVSQALGKKQG